MPSVRSLTLEQAVALIEEMSDDELESAEVAILPPENNDDSDNDEGDDQEVGVLQDVPGIIEACTSQLKKAMILKLSKRALVIEFSDTEWQQYRGRYT